MTVTGEQSLTPTPRAPSAAAIAFSGWPTVRFWFRRADQRRLARDIAAQQGRISSARDLDLAAAVLTSEWLAERDAQLIAATQERLAEAESLIACLVDATVADRFRATRRYALAQAARAVRGTGAA